MFVHINDVVLVGTVHADLDGFERLETVLGTLRPRVIAVESSRERAKLFDDRGKYDARSIFHAAHARFIHLLEQFLADPATFDRVKRRYRAVQVNWTMKQLAAIEAGVGLVSACYGFELMVARKYAMMHPGTEIAYIDLPEGRTDVDLIRRGKSAEMASRSTAGLRLLAENQPALEYGLLGFVTLLRRLQDRYYEEAGGVLRRRYEQEVANWDQLPTGDSYRRAVYHPKREPHMAAQIRALSQRAAAGEGRAVAIVGATHLTGLSRLLDRKEYSSILLSEVDVLKTLVA